MLLFKRCYDIFYRRSGLNGSYKKASRRLFLKRELKLAVERVCNVMRRAVSHKDYRCLFIGELLFKALHKN